MKIIGDVSNIIFSNNENNYKIFVVVDNNNERHTLCGYLLDLHDDLTYEFECEEVNHPKYGKQYKVLSYHIQKDNSREGIISYLSSNLFPGVGLISAEQIYDALGDNCLEMIEKDPSVLDMVSKLTKNQKEIIYHKVIENRVIEDIFVNLYQIGLTPKMVMTLYEKYQENTLSIIQENPYRLIYDIEGFGFKKTDELAMKLGFKIDYIERLKALLVFTMLNLSNQFGLTYLTKEQLLQSSYRYGLENSRYEMNILDEALEKVVFEGKIIVENERYYLPYLYHSELKVAKKINAILGMPKIKPKKALFETLLNDFERINDIEFAPLQKEAIISAISSRINVITGGPGTGKTTIIQAILQIYCGLHGYSPYDDEVIGRVLLCAPTGKASKRMTEQTLFPASTIHKALGYNFENEFAFNSSNNLPHHLIVIDEASMIDTILAGHLFDAISVNAQIVIVGDVFQLPSIGPGALLKDLIDSNVIPTTYLKTIYRQKEGSSIVKFSEMLKNGHIDTSIFNNEDLVYLPCDLYSAPNILKNVINDSINNGYSLYEDIQVLAPMYKGNMGIDYLNRMISDHFNLCNTYEVNYKDKLFKENDKVIQLTNSSELKIMNGDLGVLGHKLLMHFDDGDKEVYDIDFDTIHVKAMPKDFDNLNLAYAISIHKSQGSEFPIVIMPIFRSYYVMLKRKLLYTAATRAKKKLVIIGDINALKLGLNTIEANRQTSLAIRLNKVVSKKMINDSEIPFDYLGEENMEGITPYSFMV